MENNFFIFTEKSCNVELERFHICTWEFKNNSAMIEFGGEISNSTKYDEENITIYLYVPWLNKKYIVKDLYDKLKESENSRFIFNDSVSGTEFLDDGKQKKGVIQKFNSRTPLCIIPLTTSYIEKNNLIKLVINLKHFKKVNIEKKPNLYFRFYIEPNINDLSTRKSGISRSTIIYDIKINEKRNLPENLKIDLNDYSLCKINNCFFFNILPNSYDLTFFDTSALKNIRTLEHGPFKKYMEDKRVKENELVVVFNKKKDEESYAFFSIYSKERIGAGQFALAVLVNLVCGILLFFPSFRNYTGLESFSKEIWAVLPIEVYISILIGLLIVGYFIWPRIIAILRLSKKLLWWKNK